MFLYIRHTPTKIKTVTFDFLGQYFIKWKEVTLLSILWQVSHFYHLSENWFSVSPFKILLLSHLLKGHTRFVTKVTQKGEFIFGRDCSSLFIFGGLYSRWESNLGWQDRIWHITNQTCNSSFLWLDLKLTESLKDGESRFSFELLLLLLWEFSSTRHSYVPASSCRKSWIVSFEAVDFFWRVSSMWTPPRCVCITKIVLKYRWKYIIENLGFIRNLWWRTVILSKLKMKRDWSVWLEQPITFVCFLHTRRF